MLDYKIKSMRYLILIVALAFSLSSCKKEKTSYEEKEDNRTLFKQKLTKKHGIKYNWNNLNYDLTYQYKPVLDSEKQIITHPILLDAYKKNNDTFIKIKCDLDRVFYFDLKIEDRLVDRIINGFNSGDHFINCVLVVKINEFQKISLITKPYSEIEYGKIDYSYIELEESNSFMGKGTIIHIQFL